MDNAFDQAARKQALDTLMDARAAHHEGRHEQALQLHLAVQQVRQLHPDAHLSFGLSFWAELAKDYPPALLELLAVRASLAEQLRAGSAGRGSFAEVARIDTHLDRTADTHALYAALERDQPALAADCAHIALPAIAECKDYAMARRLLGDPLAHIARHARHFGADGMLDTSPEKPLRMMAEVSNYAEEVGLVSRIVRGCGEDDAPLRAYALDMLANDVLREKVARELASPGAARHELVEHQMAMDRAGRTAD